jgi:hypothetical protein
MTTVANPALVGVPRVVDTTMKVRTRVEHIRVNPAGSERPNNPAEYAVAGRSPVFTPAPHQDDRYLRERPTAADRIARDVPPASAAASTTANAAHQTRHAHDKQTGVSPGRVIAAFLVFVAVVVLLGYWLHPQFRQNVNNILNWRPQASKVDARPTAGVCVPCATGYTQDPASCECTLVSRRTSMTPVPQVSRLPTPEELYRTVPHRTARVCVPCADGYTQDKDTCECSRWRRVELKHDP